MACLPVLVKEDVFPRYDLRLLGTRAKHVMESLVPIDGKAIFGGDKDSIGQQVSYTSESQLISSCFILLRLCFCCFFVQGVQKIGSFKCFVDSTGLNSLNPFLLFIQSALAFEV